MPICRITINGKVHYEKIVSATDHVDDEAVRAFSKGLYDIACKYNYFATCVAGCMIISEWPEYQEKGILTTTMESDANTNKIREKLTMLFEFEQ